MNQRKQIIWIIFIGFSINSFSQIRTNVNCDSIYTLTQIYKDSLNYYEFPKYSMETDSIIAFINKNLKICPFRAGEIPTQTTCWVEFSVCKEGNTFDFKLLRIDSYVEYGDSYIRRALVDSNCVVNEAFRIVSLLKLIPGTRNSEKICVSDMKIPIRMIGHSNNLD